MLQFTKEIKQNWLNALKSGKYIQGTGVLTNGVEHCCIGVLGDITEGLDNSSSSDDVKSKSPFVFLNNTIGTEKCTNLYRTNDSQEHKRTGKTDYSNVIPLIEELKTVD